MQAAQTETNERSRAMYYVVDKVGRFTIHEGSEASCRKYVRNVGSLYGKYSLVICNGTKERDAEIRFQSY